MKGVNQSFHETVLPGNGKIHRIGKSVRDIYEHIKEMSFE